jgi:tetratricopeptide (TPR) repeat protein
VIRLLLVVLALGFAGCRESAVERIHRAQNDVFEKNPDGALKEFRRALDLIERDDSAEARVLQARALKGAADVYYLELRDFRRGAEVYQQLIRDCPEAPESLQARVLLADILQTHFRDLRGAITELSAAIDRNAPESAELSYKVAKLYFELGDYQQASLEAKKVRERYETSPFVDDSMLLEAQALAMMEDRSADAFRTFQALVTSHPDSELVPHALYEMGKVKAERGEREEAISLWVRALSRHPDPQLVQGSIARVRRQILERSPVGVGNVAAALDRGHLPGQPKSSLEAAGVTASQAAHESGD